MRSSSRSAVSCSRAEKRVELWAERWAACLALVDLTLGAGVSGAGGGGGMEMLGGGAGRRGGGDGLVVDAGAGGEEDGCHGG